MEVQTEKVKLRVDLDEVEAVMEARVEDVFRLGPASYAYLHSYHLCCGAVQPEEYTITDSFDEVHQAQEPLLEMNSHKLRSIKLRHPPVWAVGPWLRGFKEVHMVTDGALVCFVSGSWSGGRLLMGYRNLLRMALAGIAAKDWDDENDEPELQPNLRALDKLSLNNIWGEDDEPIPFDLIGPTGLDFFDDDDDEDIPSSLKEITFFH